MAKKWHPAMASWVGCMSRLGAGAGGAMVMGLNPHLILGFFFSSTFEKFKSFGGLVCRYSKR